MKLRTLILGLLATLGLAAANAQAAVIVSFQAPERYTDVGGWGHDPKPAIDAIGRHLEQLGSRYLSPRETLRIEVVDIDLAGTVWPVGSTRYPTRVIRSAADWPRMTLRYTLEVDGKASETREENLTYGAALAHGAGVNEAYYHEKRMLNDWFRARFGNR